MNVPVPILDSLDALEFQTDAYVLDVWGVLWDGIAPYPEAAACLERLCGRPVVLLSNAPRHPEEVVRSLEQIGIDRRLHDGAITSGGLCRNALARDRSEIAEIGNAYHYIGLEKDRGLLEGLAFAEARSLGDASFILNLGTRTLGDPLDNYRDELAAAAKRRLPMVCGNPDTVIVRRDGTKIVCAGALANLYQELGGKVFAFGKPLRPTYEKCLSFLRNHVPSLKPENILAIGDSLETDIRGAREAGFKTALVAGGIHADELGADGRNPPDPGRVMQLVQKSGIRPDAVLHTFR